MRTEGVTCVWSLAAWPCAMADSDKAMPLRACRMRSHPHVDVRVRSTWVWVRVRCLLSLFRLRFLILYNVRSPHRHRFTVVISAIHGTPQRHIVTKVAATKAKVLSEAGSRGRSTELTYRDTTQKQASLRVRAGPHLPQNHHPNITSRGTSVRLRSDVDVSRRQRR